VSIRVVLEIIVVVLVLLRVGQRLLARRRLALAAGGARCPSCGAARLVVTEAMMLPDGVELSALACRRCDLRGVGVRAGAAERRGWPMEPIAWGRLSAALRRCPAPRDPACGCAEHARYRRGLDEVPHDAGAGFTLG
jgi:hypothetical protein